MKGTLRLFIILLSFSLPWALASCDLRNETAKKGVEKYSSTPPPPVSPLPTPTPVDPADIAKVDTDLEGETISITGHEQTKAASCTKYNRLLVNGDGSTITVTGVCRQIMVNGDGNKISLDAASEFVLNGSENSVRYSRYPNGKQPIVVENRPGNVVEKSPTVTNPNSKRNIVK